LFFAIVVSDPGRGRGAAEATGQAPLASDAPPDRKVLPVTDAVTDASTALLVIGVWGELPVLLISVVFAALFLGKTIPGLRDIWEVAGPQVALGQSIAWGQYVIGIGLGLLVLAPVFGMDPIAGALLDIGFEGGHGTAAGLSDTFEEFGFAEGTDLALGLATVGLVAGVLIGTVLVNWGVRTGRIELDDAGDPVDAARAHTHEDLDDLDDREGPAATSSARPIRSRSTSGSSRSPSRSAGSSSRAWSWSRRRCGAATMGSSSSSTCPCSPWRCSVGSCCSSCSSGPGGRRSSTAT
jgi:hypothetical protein